MMGFSRLNPHLDILFFGLLILFPRTIIRTTNIEQHFFYIQIKIYNFSYILLYFLIITIRHYRDNYKRTEITRLPYGYMKQNEDNATMQENFTQESTSERKRRRTTYS